MASSDCGVPLSETAGRRAGGNGPMRGSATLVIGAVSLALTACSGGVAPPSSSDDSAFSTLAPTPTPIVGIETSRPSTPTPFPTPSPTPLPTELEGGLLATFRVGDEQFHVWVTNQFSVHMILRVHGGTSTSFVPNGRVRSGPGEGGHNAPWSWHLDPEDTGMDHFAMPDCDGAPSEVERNLDHFLDVVERYCPSNADLVRVDYVPSGK